MRPSTVLAAIKGDPALADIPAILVTIVDEKNRGYSLGAADINERILDWIDGVGDRPFFVFANYMDVHGPYIPPPGYEGRFGPEGPPRRANVSGSSRATSAPGVTSGADALLDIGLTRADVHRVAWGASDGKRDLNDESRFDA